VTPNESTARQLSWLWGSTSMRSDDISSYDEMVSQAVHHAKSSGLANDGDCIVVVAGVPFGKSGSTNNLRIVTV
jgi:pyruvate kinase